MVGSSRNHAEDGRIDGGSREANRRREEESYYLWPTMSYHPVLTNFLRFGGCMFGIIVVRD